MSVAELLSNQVKPWADLYLSSISLNNSSISGVTGNSPFDTYVTTSASLSSTGATGGVQLPIQFTRIGNCVNATWNTTGIFTPGASATMNFTIPDGFVPLVSLNVPVLINNNSIAAFGYVSLSNTGAMTFTTAANGASFSSGTSCSIAAGCATYYAG